MLSLKSVRHLYGAREALKVERFEAAAGEHWLVLGPSGCGKTTLLHIVSGLLRPSEGEVRVGDQPLAALAGSALDRWRGRTLGIVPQKLHLVPSLSVLQNLLLAQFLAGMPEDSTRARAVLDQVQLGERRAARPAQLSHGEAQRAAVARATVNRPRVLIADEPTSNLDDANCERALDLLQTQARECGATLVIATHDQRARSRFAQRLELPQ
ncbi:MAG TPA: ATP-binding cassette domain-containing protein [Burkholderiales bacterium]|nr:ATP-binding cassette domain-containing protein [Burkholderiales bacterium]